MQFASRVANSSSMASPLARPYHPDGPVAAYMQEDQACASASESTPPALQYSQHDMQRLEAILQELEDLPIEEDDNSTAHQHNHTTPPTLVEPLIPGFERPAALPMRARPTSPPTPAVSIKPLLPEEPAMRVTMHVWDAMGRDLKKLKGEKQALEIEIARMQKTNHSVSPHGGDDHNELQTKIGMLRYQNELNKTQKATMARALAEKDVQIKQLQLDVDNLREDQKTAASASTEHINVAVQRDYLQLTLKNNEISHSHRLSDLNDNKNREIESLQKRIDDLQDAIKQSEIRTETATKPDEFKALAQKRLDQLNQREKLLRSTQEKYAVEHTKVAELEDLIEDLQRKLNQVGDLQGKLREKSSDCDRLRTRINIQEKSLEDYRQRITRASDVVAALRGGAHLVRPRANAKLSKMILGCSECYAKNISCDNQARCRHCTENNEICARWRCSLQHIHGSCPDAPCRLPHDEAGWLGLVTQRPEW